MKRLYWVVLIILAVLITRILIPPALPPGVEAKKQQIYASIYPLVYIASYLSHEFADVHGIIPAGIEPHEYELTPRQSVLLEQADIILLNGDIEPWASQDSPLPPEKTHFIGKKYLASITQRTEERSADPHVWLDPAIMKSMSRDIAQILISNDTKNQQYCEKRLLALTKELEELDSKYSTALRACVHRDFITSHDAFSYLAKRYNLNQIAITGISPEAEPTATQLARIASIAREKNIRVIFFETLVSPKISETLAREIGARTLILDPVEGIAEEEQKKGVDYLRIMEENLNNLVLALECQK